MNDSSNDSRKTDVGAAAPARASARPPSAALPTKKKPQQLGIVDDADDATFGLMFDVCARDDHLSVSAIWALSDWAEIPNVTVWVAEESFDVCRDTPSMWALAARGRFGRARHVAQRFALEEPLHLKPRQVRGVYIHTMDANGLALSGDDDRVTCECDALRLHRGVATVSDAPFEKVGDTQWSFRGSVEFTVDDASEVAAAASAAAAAVAAAAEEALGAAAAEAAAAAEGGEPDEDALVEVMGEGAEVEAAALAAAIEEAKAKCEAEEEEARRAAMLLENEAFAAAAIAERQRRAELEVQLKENNTQPFLSCHRCKGLLVDPVKLPRCDHKFCRACVVDAPLDPADGDWTLVVCRDRQEPIRLRCHRHHDTIGHVKRKLFSLLRVATRTMRLQFLKNGTTMELEDTFTVATYGLKNAEELDLSFVELADTEVRCPACRALVMDYGQPITSENMPPPSNARLARLAAEYGHLTKVFDNW